MLILSRENPSTQSENLMEKEFWYGEHEPWRGNDNEWRYIPVCRFFMMVEESVKKSTEWAVFEPNDANTWTKIRAAIENFLTIQWQAGALAGATTSDAFFVKIGLGQTMTSIDILEGRMIIEIGMAVVRPAEFIILRIAHKMANA